MDASGAELLATAERRLLVKQPMARTARSNLAWALVGFLLVQLVLAVALERGFDGARDPLFVQKFDRLQAARTDAPVLPLVLVLGSSHTDTALHADRLGFADNKRQALVFNFALPGAGPSLEHLYLKRLLAAHIRPDHLLIEINPAFLLACDTHPLEEKCLDCRSLRWRELLWLRRYATAFDRWVMRWLWSRLVACRLYQPSVAAWLTGSDDAAITPSGWTPGHAEAGEEDHRVYDKMAHDQYEDALRDFHFADSALRALNDLLQLARSRAIPCTLFLTPEGSVFRGYYSATGNNALHALLAQLQSTWKVRVVDGRSWVPDADFWDTHHVLRPGAEMFTERLDRELLSPLVTEIAQANTRTRLADGSRRDH